MRQNIKRGFVLKMIWSKNFKVCYYTVDTLANTDINKIETDVNSYIQESKDKELGVSFNKNSDNEVKGHCVITEISSNFLGTHSFQDSISVF